MAKQSISRREFVMMNVADSRRTISRCLHRDLAAAVVAALAADPGTIEELQSSLVRYLPAPAATTFFEDWNDEFFESKEMTTIIVDLPSRFYSASDEVYLPAPCGVVSYVSPDLSCDYELPYTLGKDWLRHVDWNNWMEVRDQRLNEHLGLTRVTRREVLYQQATTFIARRLVEMWAGDDHQPRAHTSRRRSIGVRIGLSS